MISSNDIMYILFFVFFIAAGITCLIFISSNDELEKENKRLKAQIEKLKTAEYEDIIRRIDNSYFSIQYSMDEKEKNIIQELRKHKLFWFGKKE